MKSSIIIDHSTVCAGEEAYVAGGGRARGVDEARFVIRSSCQAPRVITIQAAADRDLIAKWFVQDLPVDDAMFIISYGGTLVAGLASGARADWVIDVGGCRFLESCCGGLRYVAVGRSHLAAVSRTLQMSVLYHGLDIGHASLEGDDVLVMRYDTPLETRLRRYGLCQPGGELRILSDE